MSLFFSTDFKLKDFPSIFSDQKIGKIRPSGKIEGEFFFQNIIQDIYGQVTNFFTNTEPTPVSGRRSFFVPKTQTRNGSLDDKRERTVSESSSKSGGKSRRGSRMFNNPFNKNRVSSIDEEDPYENVTVNDGSVLPSITLSPVNEEGPQKKEKNQYLTEYL